MQKIDLVHALDPNNPAKCEVKVPEGYALARIPTTGRGALARWLAGLPNGTTIEANSDQTGRVCLVKSGGQFVNLAEVA